MSEAALDQQSLGDPEGDGAVPAKRGRKSNAVKRQEQDAFVSLFAMRRCSHRVPSEAVSEARQAWDRIEETAASNAERDFLRQHATEAAIIPTGLSQILSQGRALYRLLATE